MIPLPAYIDPEAWQAFLEVRQKLKAPNTDYAQKLLLVKLLKLKSDGHDPSEVLAASIVGGWKGLFPIKEDRTEASGKLPEYKPEPTQASKPPGWFKDKHIRRVA